MHNCLVRQGHESLMILLSACCLRWTNYQALLFLESGLYNAFYEKIKSTYPKMKYLLILLLILTAWYLVGEFLSKPKGFENEGPFWDRLKQIGRHFHWVMGIVAILLIIIAAARLIYQLVSKSN